MDDDPPVVGLTRQESFVRIVSLERFLKMKNVTIYPRPVCYTHFFQNMGTSHLKIWIEVALRKLPYLRGEEKMCVLRAMIQAGKELTTR